MTRAQLVVGVGFIALGAVLLLDRAGELDAGEILGAWWPTLVILLGVAQLLMRPRHVATGVFITVMGGALLAWSAAGIDTLSLLWPLALVALGLVLLVRRPRRSRDPHVVTDDEILAIFDDRSVRAPTGTLASRSVTTIFGDLEVDLRNATLEAGTTLQVVTIFGDVDLTVPEDWMISTSGPQIFGVVRIQPPPATGATRDGLHLDVVAIFGDIEVRREAATDRSSPQSS